MAHTSPVPRRLRPARWLDVRVIAGVALLLGSAVAGALIVASAGRTERYWAADRPLAAGVLVRAADLRAEAVRVTVGSAYFPTTYDLAGQTLTSPIGTGALVPRTSVGRTPAMTVITVPLADGQAPRIHAGDRIRVWVSTRDCGATLVLADTPVQDVTQGSATFGTAGTQSVVVRLSDADADRVVRALAIDGALVRAGIVDGSATATVVRTTTSTGTPMSTSAPAATEPNPGAQEQPDGPASDGTSTASACPEPAS